MDVSARSFSSSCRISGERDWVVLTPIAPCRSSPNRHLVLFFDIRNLADFTCQPNDYMPVTRVQVSLNGLLL